MFGRWIVVMILMALFTRSVSATNVMWNKFSGETVQYGLGEETFNVSYYGYVEGTIQSNPEIAFETDVKNRRITLTPTSSTVNASVTELWLLMNPGDIVSYENIRGAGKYLFNTLTVPSGGSDYGFSMEHGDLVYLVFESIETTDKSIYGWVSLSYQYGVLSVVESAFDADGGPMIVGGGAFIPEPSSALLLLVGGAMLGLRRRRRR